MIRTSYSHPLRIDTIAVGSGKIGLSVCPGKVQAQSYTGGWNRDLDIDLDAIKSWNAGIVLTLLEQDEIQALGVPTLKESIIVRSMDWLHMPFPNDSVPNTAWIEKFKKVQPEISRRIAQGEGVFIHCMGGIGRTSVVGALLLIHAGWTAEQSISAIHQVRPGSFVMPEQDIFVRNYEQTLPRNILPGPQPI